MHIFRTYTCTCTGVHVKEHVRAHAWGFCMAHGYAWAWCMEVHDGSNEHEGGRTACHPPSQAEAYL